MSTFLLNTQRLHLREFTEADADFILRLLNEPSFIENIADRGVRNVEQAVAYLRDGAMRSYQTHGFGFWAVCLAVSNQTIGMCGLVKRDNLPEADLGYAFLPEFCGQGFAREAARACMVAAREQFHLAELLAIVNQQNHASQRMLKDLGFEFKQLIALYADEPDLCLFHCSLDSNSVF